MPTSALTKDQISLITLMLQHQALRFGEFTTKSGRQTPYFVNLGNISSGSSWDALCRIYAAHLARSIPKNSKPILYGPAYKGIPLCVGVATALSVHHHIDAQFVFNRKEIKTHGEGGSFIGATLKSGDKVIIVEDVLTAGSSIAESVAALAPLGVGVDSIYYVLDRCEKAADSRGARAFIEATYKTKVHALLTIRDVVAHLEKHPHPAASLGPDIMTKIHAYWQLFGSQP